MIQAKDIAYEYFRRDAEGNVIEVKRALDGVDLQIQPGSFVAVLGANGSGKSTFARHLNALLTPAEGTLYVDGKDTSDPDQTMAIRKTAGMVFQNPDNQIIAGMVEEDVGFGPENIGVPTEEIWKRVTESLKKVGMYAYREVSPNHLSGGQKQRVAIAGIIAMKPKCIILDEPTAMLDPQGRRSVLKTVHQLNRTEKITVILITHYMEEVVDADYVYVMGDGKVRLQGVPRQIFASPEVLEQWRLDVPEITRIAAGLRAAGVPVPADIIHGEELAQWLLRFQRDGKS
ncbi:MAG: energy-coupling factor transporter ATPase [Lachnospiraceae bacterium]|nr:energy-coupling factor transporter ATPase [Lachnospiraceae bacterium]